MDPNRCLEEIRNSLEEATASESLTVKNYYRQQACELFEMLDDWISKGGFRPDDWNV